MVTNKRTILLFVLALAAGFAGNAKGSAKKDDQSPSYKKSRYRVDVLAPLYLDELVKGHSTTFKDKMPEKAQVGVAFYAGITLAADSLKKEGFNIDIYVHDAASANESPGLLISTGRLDSSDLIIGAELPQDVRLLSDFAKKKGINYISTLGAAYVSAKHNPYLTLLQPTLKTHCERIVAELIKNAAGEKVTVLYRTKDEADDACYDYVTDAAANKVRLQYMACNKPPKKANLKLFIDPRKPVTLLVPVSEIDYADSLLHSLSADFPDTHFDVYGMPSWAAIADLKKKDALKNITVHITVAATLDRSNAMGQYVRHIYTQVYAGKISEPVYEGFETLFMYASLLRKYGAHFNEKYNDVGTHAPFEIQPQADRSGSIRYYENTRAVVNTFGDK